MEQERIWEAVYMAHIDALQALIDAALDILKLADPVDGNHDTIDRTRVLLQIAKDTGDIVIPDFMESER